MKNSVVFMVKKSHEAREECIHAFEGETLITSNIAQLTFITVSLIKYSSMKI